MNLTPIRANMTEVDTGKVQILFSYKTPVAFHYSGDDTIYVTEKFWSRTTSRHIKQWAAGNPVVKISQEKIEEIL